MDFPSPPQWFAENEQARQSLEDFHNLMREEILPIENAYKIIQYISLPFGTREVLPFHCRKAIRGLLELKAHLARCCHLLRETSILPVVFLALRYQLLDELHYIEEQADKLIYRIENYTGICMSATQEAASQEYAIQELFNTLLHLIHRVPVQLTFLFDEARFQEKRLASTSLKQ